jgi:N-acetylornithine carbamoyltransferase
MTTEGRSPMHRHVLSLGDLDRTTIERLLVAADGMRGRRRLDVLAGRSVALVFFNPSLRTRVSMELGAQELGAYVTTLNVGGDVWKLEWRDGAVMDGDKAEHVKEAVKVLSRYADLVGVRAFPEGKSWAEDREDPIVRSFARHADVPVLNLEGTLDHPCQGLADVLTIRRALGPRPGKIVLCWANHPKALPVAVPCAFATSITRMGWDLTIARPEGYDLPDEVMARCRAFAAEAGSRLEVTADRDQALTGARIVYAKSWGRIDRYGQQEQELRERKERGLASWIVDEQAMAKTEDALFMHCLPVRRNVVVSDAVIDSKRSIVYDQAENRLHGQKALMTWQLGAL